MVDAITNNHLHCPHSCSPNESRVHWKLVQKTRSNLLSASQTTPLESTAAPLPDADTTSVSSVRKDRVRWAKWLAQGHTASKQNWHLWFQIHCFSHCYVCVYEVICKQTNKKKYKNENNKCGGNNGRGTSQGQEGLQGLCKSNWATCQGPPGGHTRVLGSLWRTS